MPRANRYVVPGNVYHLTHRCHDREFLFKFARDRDSYRQLLWRSLREFPVSVFAYCLTSNHTHLLVRSESLPAMSRWMQQVEGEFAQAYNRRKHRSGAFWCDRYHCTMIEEGRHLWNCMVYVELNMVRAGVVVHPAQWHWCSCVEWMGTRQRYRVVDQNGCLRLVGAVSVSQFRDNYEALISRALAGENIVREARWTEGIAVGSRLFVEGIAQRATGRQELEREEVGENAWVLRESQSEGGATCG